MVRRNEDIIKAYRLLALKYHPDKNKTDDSSKFQEIVAAYECLVEPEKRQLYDQYGQSMKPSTGEILSNAITKLAPLLLTFVIGFCGGNGYKLGILNAKFCAFLQGAACILVGAFVTQPTKIKEPSKNLWSDFFSVAFLGLLAGNTLGVCSASFILFFADIIGIFNFAG